MFAQKHHQVFWLQAFEAYKQSISYLFLDGLLNSAVLEKQSLILTIVWVRLRPKGITAVLKWIQS